MTETTKIVGEFLLGVCALVLISATGAIALGYIILGPANTIADTDIEIIYPNLLPICYDVSMETCAFFCGEDGGCIFIPNSI